MNCHQNNDTNNNEQQQWRWRLITMGNNTVKTKQKKTCNDDNTQCCIHTCIHVYIYVYIQNITMRQNVGHAFGLVPVNLKFCWPVPLILVLSFLVTPCRLPFLMHNSPDCTLYGYLEQFDGQGPIVGVPAELPTYKVLVNASPPRRLPHNHWPSSAH